MTQLARSWSIPAVAWRARLPLVVVWSATAAYALLAAYFSLKRHDAFLSGFDVATLDQELWLLANGHEPVNTQDGRLFWGEHFSISMVLLVPLYWLGAGPATLLVVQALTMATVAPLLYALARAYGAARWLAVVPALLWLVSPLTLAANLFDVHHVPLVAPAVVGSVLALRRDRLGVFAALGVLACLAKEDISLMYVMLGIVLALEGRRRLGGAIAASALGLFAVVTLVVMPAFSDALSWHADRFAGDRGDSLADALVWMASHPLGALEDLLTLRNLGICSALVVVTGGLCCLAIRWMLLGVPTLAFNLFSAYPTQHELANHYYVPVILAFAVAAAVGVRRLPSLRPAYRLAIGACMLTGFMAFFFGLSTAKADSEWSAAIIEATGGPEARRAAVALIPDGVAVAATPKLTAHLSQRQEIYTLPLPFAGREEVGADWSAAEMARRADGVDWVALDLVDRTAEFPQVSERLPPILEALGFDEILRRGTVVVYRRGQPSTP